MSKESFLLKEVLKFPLTNALFGRRSRRFGVGMEIPSGPLKYNSNFSAMPLTEFEESLLIAAATGVTGWNFGIPHGPANPNAHADHAVRFTGRTMPTAAGIGTPILFYTNDNGIFVINTRGINPNQISEMKDMEEITEWILENCHKNSSKLGDSRLDLPSIPGHILDPNLWWANKPGSTLFMPIGDASEEMLGVLSIFLENGYLIMDDQTGQPAGNLEPFISSGLLNKDKPFPLSFLETNTFQANCAELSFMGHNMVLMMQAMGLGGLYFVGLNPMSILGAPTAEGIKGLGFTFVENEDWTVPNPVGLDGIYEALCPPYFPTMRAAVEMFAKRKYGPEGAYNPNTPGPWKESSKVKKTVSPYSEEMTDCLSEVAQYIYDKYGKFPGTNPTIALTGFIQAHHLDIEYYDKFFKSKGYMETHATHMKRWHSKK
ncbi:MAG: hypothetical protein BAJALOKI1v1_2410002 [Promethearchaeota archaeon]|nr:MAG: hypothetical protein BAJALOKI1v1_2410002 [Candidatus Lokiarchaeota archaeon]